jgi:FkbM family methyltransferase
MNERTIQKFFWRKARPIANRFNIDVVRLNAFPFMRHIERLGVNLIFDVGANVGQYGQLLRSNGYRGKLVSFEPIRTVHDALAVISQPDRSWTAENCALGAEAGETDIKVSEHTTMSSILEIKPEHITDFPYAAVTRTERIKVRTLDEVFSQYASPSDVCMLKLDVQGYEDQVLLGAKSSLARLPLIQMEAAVEGIYQNEPTMFDHVRTLASKNYRLIDIAEAFRDSCGRLLHTDCMFERR